MTSMANQPTLTASAPAKLILSGEHAVVHGAPAIAMAVDRLAETSLSWRVEHHSIGFYLRNLGYTSSMTVQKLRELKFRAQRKYDQFLNGECTICDVLVRSFELLQYTFIHLIDRLNITLPQGLDIHTQSNIPIGCGMGSSSASIVSVLSAVSAFLDLDMQMDHFLQFGRNVENLQHGKSSGLDLHLAIHGGACHFADGEVTGRRISKLPMYMVNTGRPLTTTGECVSAVKSHFTNSKTLIADFAAVTAAFDQALQQNSIANVKECIRANHRLLMHIGVVPTKVQNFIAEMEEVGAAAKICGAGACAGQQAGMVLVVTEESVTPIVEKYRYSISPIIGNDRGIHIC